MHAELAQYPVRNLGRGGQRLDLLLERHESLLDDWILSYVDGDLLWLTWLLCELQVNGLSGFGHRLQPVIDIEIVVHKVLCI